MADPLVGVQIGPISFLDEGVEACLDTLQRRGGVNTVMIGMCRGSASRSGAASATRFPWLRIMHGKLLSAA
jgi:hypothetical protein